MAFVWKRESVWRVDRTICTAAEYGVKKSARRVPMGAFCIGVLILSVSKAAPRGTYQPSELS